MASVRREVVAALARSDMPRSELEAHSTGGAGGGAALDQVLEQVADYQAPTAQLPGLYRLKPEAWREFDPYFLRLDRSRLQVAPASRPSA